MRRFIKMFKNSIIGKILKAIFKIVCWALEILIIFIAIVIVTQRVTNNQKAFLGFRIFSVATGSMEPEYAVGDILISREKNPSDIKVGENIVYLGDEGGYDGKIITHNVIEIEQDENGNYLFHTKGRANTVEDPIVHEDQLYGTIVYNNQVLALLCKILTNRYGLYFFAIIPITLYFFIGFIRVQGEKIEEEREQRRLEEERRKRAHKVNRPQRPRRIQEIEEPEEIEEIEEPEEIEGFEETEQVVEEKPKTPRKTKSTTTRKKKVEAENIVEEVEEKKKTTTTKSRKPKTTTKSTKKEETENIETTKKTTTRKKKAKEE